MKFTTVGLVLILAISLIFIVGGWRGTYRDAWAAISQKASGTSPKLAPLG